MRLSFEQGLQSSARNPWVLLYYCVLLLHHFFKDFFLQKKKISWISVPRPTVLRGCPGSGLSSKAKSGPRIRFRGPFFLFPQSWSLGTFFCDYFSLCWRYFISIRVDHSWVRWKFIFASGCLFVFFVFCRFDFLSDAQSPIWQIVDFGWSSSLVTMSYTVHARRRSTEMLSFHIFTITTLLFWSLSSHHWHD